MIVFLDNSNKNLFLLFKCRLGIKIIVILKI